MRRLSCRSLPTTKRPPAPTTSSCAASISPRIVAARASRWAASSIAGELGLEPHVEIAAELNVGAAAGHVGGDRHRAGPAGLGDDEGFLLVIAGVQHVVRDLVLFEERRQRLGFLDADRADQHRLLLLLALQHLLHDRVVFLARRAVDLVVGVVAADRLVGRDLDDLEPVDVAEFLRLGHRRAGHAGELRIEPEIVLEGDRGERLVLVLDGDAFLGLERLVQPLRIAPAFHHAAGELVDDDDLVVLDDVVGVAGEQLVRAQRLVDVVDQRDIVDVVERAGRHQAVSGAAASSIFSTPARSA